MGQVWGTVGLNDRTFKEIKKREGLLGAEYRSPDLLTYLNANNVWVKLQSGVNVNDSDADARSYVLTGFRQGSDRAGVDLTMTSPEASNGVYYNSRLFGFRPAPGITGVSIKNRDTFGAVQEISINVKVFCLEDLEKLNKIYFRPGFTAIFEWGWTLDYDGRTLPIPTKTIDYFGTEELPDVQRLAVSTRDPNHGVLCGYIVNFSYNLKKDGTYDCTIQILGLGAVLEGLKISKAPGGTTYVGKNDSGDQDLTSSWIAPIRTAIQTANLSGNTTISIANLLKAAQIHDGKPEVVEDLITGGETGKPTKQTFAIYSSRNVFLRLFKITLKNNAWYSFVRYAGMNVDADVMLAYVRFEDLLRMVNGLDIHGQLSPYYFGTSDEDDMVHGGNRYDNKYVCPTSLFSLDPYKVIIPGRIERNAGKGAWEVPLAQVNVASFDGAAGRIFDLYVSVNWVADVIGSMISEKDSDYHVIDYLRTILNGINKALGNITNLDIGIDECNLRYYVVDRNYQGKFELPKIIPCGTKTTLLDLDVKSEVSDEMANMMSVAAQGGKDNISPTLTAWNKGLSERHPLPEGEKVSTDTSNPEKSKPEEVLKESGNLEEFKKKATKTYQEMFNKSVFSTDKTKDGSSAVGQYSLEAYLTLQLVGETMFNTDMQRYYGPDGGPVGVFPVTFGFTMRGIEGFVIGETFGVEKGLLPADYDNWGYIVTGVEHSIDTSGWVTKVNSQYFPADKVQTAASAFVQHEESQKLPPATQKAVMEDVKKATLSGKWQYKVFRSSRVKPERDVTTYLKEATGLPTSSKHTCARGTFQYATLMTLGNANTVWQKKGNIPGHAGGNADQATYFSNLKASCGYVEIESGKDVTVGELKYAINKMQIGDVVAYWNYDVGKKHTCIKGYAGTFVSDYIQRSGFVYNYLYT